jgi:hypothetical protein
MLSELPPSVKNFLEWDSMRQPNSEIVPVNQVCSRFHILHSEAI